MPKIMIDHTTFNKAILSKKLEVAEFLIEHDCPFNSTSYLQCLDISVFQWLEHRVPIDDYNFAENLIEKTTDTVILEWFFLYKKIPITREAVDCCIMKKDKNTLHFLLNLQKGCCKAENFITACKAGDIDILKVLKENNCPFNQGVEKFVLTFGDKQILKWFFNNDYI